MHDIPFEGGLGTHEKNAPFHHFGFWSSWAGFLFNNCAGIYNYLINIGLVPVFQCLSVPGLW